MMILLLLVFPLLSYGTLEVRAGGGGSFAQATFVATPNSYQGANGAGYGVIEPEVSAGPNHVMEVMQGACQIFFKSLGATQNCFMGQILNTYQNCGDIGDSRVTYDSLSQKWFVVAISNVYSSCPYSNQTFLQHFADIAVSPTSDPSTSLPGTLFPQNWYEFHAVAGFSGSSNYTDVTHVDHPEIGITSDKLVLTTNDFGKLYVYNKADLVNCANNGCLNPPTPQDLTIQIPWQCDGDQPYPVHNYGSTTRQYLICGYPTFYLFYIDGAAPNAICYVSPGVTCNSQGEVPPQITTVQTLPTCCGTGADTANASSDGGTLPGYITFTGPPLSISAVWSNNMLWFATTSGCSPSSTSLGDCITLAQVNPSNSQAVCSTFVCQSFLYNLTGWDLFLPALSIDSQGDLAMVFGYSSGTSYPSLGITGQTPNDLQGSLIPWKSLKTGSGYAGLKRFSDYFGAATDPSDTTIIWVSGGYYTSPTCYKTGTNPCWASWVGGLRVVGLALSANVSSFNVGSGQLASLPVKVHALASLSGNVSVSATITQTYGPTASVSPSSLRLSLGGAANTTVTVNASGIPVSYGWILSVTGSTPDFSLNLYITVNVVTPLICSANASPTGGLYHVTVHFSVSCSSGSPPYSYLWRFNDGSGATNSSQSTTYTYYYNPNPGHVSNYYPTVTVTDSKLSYTFNAPTITVTCRSNGCANSPSP